MGSMGRARDRRWDHSAGGSSTADAPVTHGRGAAGSDGDGSSADAASPQLRALPRRYRERAAVARRCAGLTRRELLGLGASLALAVPALALADEGTQNDSEVAGSSAQDQNASSAAATSGAGEILVELSDDGVTVNGVPASEGTSADAAAATQGVYLAHDVIHYEDRDTYDSGNAYGEGTQVDRHSDEEAAAVTVVHVAQAGTYRLAGTLSNGQVAIDLGEGAEQDPAAVVTLVLDGVDLTCAVAPAVVFYRVYECDGAWSEAAASAQVDTTAAGANVVLADGSANTVSGSHVARIYTDDAEQDKLWKIDGAFHSFMSMNVGGEDQGTGSLTVVGDCEGLDSELHLTINGGRISVLAQDDAINTSEDNVSVCTINGGSLHVMGGLGEEGDGIDSNGWLVINGGTVVALANPRSDSGLDATMGAYVNGGTVVALGSTMDWAESDSDQVAMNLQFAQAQDAGDAIVVTDEDGAVVFAYDPSEDEVTGTEVRSYQGAVLSCPAFAVEASYHVYIGGVVSGEEVEGVYDVSSVTGYEGGVRQAYTGTDVAGGSGGFGGFGGAGRPGEAGGSGEPPSGERPDDAPEPPQGEAGGPAGEEPSAVGETSGAPGSGAEAASGTSSSGASDVFLMEDKVNAFSGVGAAS